jgi:hypothetical protein
MGKIYCKHLIYLSIMSNTGIATILTTVSNLSSHIKVLNSQTYRQQ